MESKYNIFEYLLSLLLWFSSLMTEHSTAVGKKYSLFYWKHTCHLYCPVYYGIPLPVQYHGCNYLMYSNILSLASEHVLDLISTWFSLKFDDLMSTISISYGVSANSVDVLLYSTCFSLVVPCLSCPRIWFQDLLKLSD